MKYFCRTLLAVALLAALINPSLVQAGNKKNTKKKDKDFTKIGAVDVSGNKVTIDYSDGTEKEYTVDSFTVILIDGKPGKLAEVQKGKKADVVASGAKIGRLEVSDPPDPKPEKKKH